MPGACPATQSCPQATWNSRTCAQAGRRTHTAQSCPDKRNALRASAAGMHVTSTASSFMAVEQGREPTRPPFSSQCSCSCQRSSLHSSSNSSRCNSSRCSGSSSLHSSSGSSSSRYDQQLPCSAHSCQVLTCCYRLLPARTVLLATMCWPCLKSAQKAHVLACKHLSTWHDLFVAAYCMAAAKSWRVSGCAAQSANFVC